MIVIDLNGTWRLRQKGKAETVAATVPGDVYRDLLAAKKIPDPFYRKQEAETQWIGESDWVYEREFETPDSIRDQKRVVLQCDGLDTLATIAVNGKTVGKTDNQFRVWEFDIAHAVRPGPNTIRITFGSAMKYVRRKAREVRPLPGWGVGQHKLDSGSWIRKKPCNFGWDWGPALVTCGIWRSMRILGFRLARLDDVHAKQQHARGAVAVNVDLKAETVARVSMYAVATLKYKGRTVAVERCDVRNRKAGLSLRVRQPRLWWPHGMGDQPLYTLSVELFRKDGMALDSWTRRIGLRKLELVRKRDRWGESFCFAANGKTFFAKGANWIPADAILSRLTPEDYRRLLQDSVDANMNMVRVWGGGIYEHDAFYELCDELGLCVWQDFMFACATYPGFDDEFVANVKAEAEDQVRRLRHHACIALWCGNNELEQGLVGEDWTDYRMNWEDYGRIFDKLLPRVVRRLDPERSYWPSSGHSPYGDRLDTRNPECGDAHLWHVWHRGEPFEWYRTSDHRFVSEFGFQSFPEPRVVAGYTVPEDRNVTSPVMEWHQRSGIGNTTIMRYMLAWFRLPGSFDMMLWLSQILQALAIKTAVENWRRKVPRCMGALYWQLNDCWPVASWASIDYPGNWKALHFAARDFFAPVLISTIADTERYRIEVHVSNDRLRAFAGRVCWMVHTLSGELLVDDSFPVRVAERSSRKCGALDIAEIVAQYGTDDIVVSLSLDDRKGELVSRNVALMARPKAMEWEDPAFRCTIKKAGARAFDVTLRCAKPALWTWLDAGPGATYEDNFFHMQPEEVVTTRVTVPDAMTVVRMNKRLKVNSLRDTYR
ncbi:MAG: glycoside hydrolase family 2 protein [Phycisphaerae bacterium]|nr:glycoside hydrolase family 2 protein [Phycisphaerae bacterium]